MRSVASFGGGRAKHRRLLLQNAAGRVIFWHGARTGTQKWKFKLEFTSESEFSLRFKLPKETAVVANFSMATGTSMLPVVGAGGVACGRYERHCVCLLAAENCFVKISF